MAYQVEFTDEFKVWYEEVLTLEEQESVARGVRHIIRDGPNLPFPYSSGISQSRYPHMRELRVQHDGRPYRVLYAFDPRRVALLLIGGDKTGEKRWYLTMVPKADSIYERHLRELENES
jgi:hypothetical protein